MNNEMPFHEIEDDKHISETDYTDQGNAKEFKYVREIENSFVRNDKNCNSNPKEIEITQTVGGANDVAISKEISLFCKTCQKSFMTKQQLTRHGKFHKEKSPYQCETCNKKFNHNCNLEVHVRIHSGDLPYECKICKKRFNKKGILKMHEKIHTGEKQYECETCNKRFNQKAI